MGTITVLVILVDCCGDYSSASFSHYVITLPPCNRVSNHPKDIKCQFTII